MEITEISPKSASPIDSFELTINGNNFGTDEDVIEVRLIA